MAEQMGLFGGEEKGPDGFRYRRELISVEEERKLVEGIRGLKLEAFVFQGHEALRRTVSFGWRYDWGARKIEPAGEIPSFLMGLREKAAGFAGMPVERLAHVLLTEYAVGTPIGWHKDKGVFGEVIGVSLLSACTFRMRRETAGGKWERYSIVAEPRSVYLLSGPAREEWEHSIPPVETLRYSVTFRTVRGMAPGG